MPNEPAGLPSHPSALTTTPANPFPSPLHETLLHFIDHTPFHVRTDAMLGCFGQLSMGCDLVVRADDQALVGLRIEQMLQVSRDLDWFFPLRVPVRLRWSDTCDLDEALRLLGRPAAGEPGFYDWLRGLALHKAGDRKGARAAFDRYFENWPGDLIGISATRALRGNG